jgi:hypothetical protein
MKVMFSKTVLGVCLAAAPLAGFAQGQVVDEFASDPVPIFSAGDSGLGTMDTLMSSESGPSWEVSPDDQGYDLSPSIGDNANIDQGLVTGSEDAPSRYSDYGEMMLESSFQDPFPSPTPDFGNDQPYTPEPDEPMSPPVIEGPYTDPPTPMPFLETPDNVDMLNQYIEQFKSDIVNDVNRVGSPESSPTGSDAQAPQ